MKENERAGGGPSDLTRLNRRAPFRRSWICRLRTLLILTIVVAGVGGCASVEPWQKETLALTPMQVDDLKCQRFERNVEVYREGAVGANGGKSGGGCGCS